MGLDMYLYANRTLDPDSDIARDVLDAARLSLTELREMAQRDPMKETSVYLSRWRFTDLSDAEQATAVLQAAGLLELGTDDCLSGDLSWVDGKICIQITCCYWRKANAIHAWFVDECQDGVDECQEADVHPEKLAELHMLCQKALAAYEAGDEAGAAAVLTPRAGFFFGGTDIDEWWAEDLRHTAAELERVINTAARLGGISFSYHSSW